MRETYTARHDRLMRLEPLDYGQRQRGLKRARLRNAVLSLTVWTIGAGVIAAVGYAAIKTAIRLWSVWP